MQRDSLSVLPKGVPPVGLEADPVAHRRASQPRLTVPHDLVPGVRIVLAGARCPPSRVIAIMRQAKTALIATALYSRAAVRNRRSSVRHPDLSKRKKFSILHLWRWKTTI